MEVAPQACPEKVTRSRESVPSRFAAPAAVNTIPDTAAKAARLAAVGPEDRRNVETIRRDRVAAT